MALRDLGPGWVALDAPEGLSTAQAAELVSLLHPGLAPPVECGAGRIYVRAQSEVAEHLRLALKRLPAPPDHRESIFVRKLVSRESAELAALLRDVLASSGRRATVVSYEPTESLIVVSRQETYRFIDRLVFKLDGGGLSGGRVLSVLPAPATEVPLLPQQR
jgi:hypothetical protein